jgi:hypothetical protein
MARRYRITQNLLGRSQVARASSWRHVNQEALHPVQTDELSAAVGSELPGLFELECRRGAV